MLALLGGHVVPQQSDERAMTSGAQFGPGLFAFLRELRDNNDRVWFAANKQRYEQHVRGPFLEFIAELAPPLAKISRQIVADPRPIGGSLFRIHRDVRFGRDKRPYKTHAGAHFAHRGAQEDVHAPGFYLHLEPDGCFAAAGVWQPDAAALQKIRDAVVAAPERWKRALGGKLSLDGATLTRPPRGFDPAHPLIEDLKRKDFVTHIVLSEKQICRAGFSDEFVAVCRTMAPLNSFLAKALDLGW
jgi:uncharacterized protein (TIGR02453 family)